MSTAPFSHVACIGLGSNLGRSRKLLKDAWQSLAAHRDIVSRVLSSPYRTKPVGMESKHWFINAVGLLETTLSPEALLDILLQTEQQFGRIRSANRSEYKDRTLDLDLLLFDDLVMHSSKLTLPHPAMHERLFVLLPLDEIAPQLRHPLQGKTITELLAEAQPESDMDEIEEVSWRE